MGSVVQWRNQDVIRIGIAGVVLAGSCLLSAQIVLRASTKFRSRALPPTGFEQSWGNGDNQFSPQGKDDHLPLWVVFDEPGVTDPELQPSDEVELPGDAEVVGVELEDQAYAFVLDALGDRRSHIVNMLAGRQPLTVTYCNKSECVRVLTDPDTDRPLDLRNGGLDRSGLVLLLADVRYSQGSKKIPLQDVPFERTTVEEWRLKHPGSPIYSGTALP